MAGREETIAARARALGFAHAGCAPLGPLPRAAFVERWLADGRAGDMRYLERRAAERADPRLPFPWARAVVSLALPYRPPAPPCDDWRTALRGRIAAYAAGFDYHDRALALAERLADDLGRLFPGARFLAYVDTGPIVERTWAERAGIGWIGRNTLVLDRRLGSYFFLVDLVTDLELDAAPEPVDYCGTCTRCVRACPTGALEDGYTMDPRRCLSYLTIEHRGPIPPALRPALDNWIFGCDICQEVCPWNGAPGPDGADDLGPALVPLLALDAAGFAARFGATAIRWAKRRGLLRNVTVALGNSGNPAAVPALVTALGDPEPLVRGHAAWALGRLGGVVARRALDAARADETDATVRAEVGDALASAR